MIGLCVISSRVPPARELIDENCSGRMNNVRILFAHVSTVIYGHQTSMMFMLPTHVSLGIQGILLDSTDNATIQHVFDNNKKKFNKLNNDSNVIIVDDSQ